MLTIGVVTYLVGLFNSAMEFNELGYYFTALLLGLYGAISLQKTVRDLAGFKGLDEHEDAEYDAPPKPPY